MKLQRAVAEISLGNLSSNLQLVRKKTGNKNILAVVKADAYGHGAVTISRHLLKNGVKMLGVACAAEGIELRNAGITVPIIVFFDTRNIEAFAEYNLTPVVFDLNTAKKISKAASGSKKLIPVHVKIDTGMGRVGFNHEEALTAVPEIASYENLRIEGIMSHFSDADLKNKNFARRQIKSFNRILSELKYAGLSFKYIHMANSAAVMTLPEAHFNTVRPGIMLYGYGCCEGEKLKPVMSVKSGVLFVKHVPEGTPISYCRTFVTKRRSAIATIALGYADGYDRRLSNKGRVIINGKFAPVAGRVCMDTFMADVTGIPNVSGESEVILIGSKGSRKITAQDIADDIGTIPYEVLTSIGKRVERVYK
ncbi:MAG: alanine racemase [Nitrospirae bacterium]|nr:alanine racemase [Nitrospirota bacterium]